MIFINILASNSLKVMRNVFVFIFIMAFNCLYSQELFFDFEVDLNEWEQSQPGHWHIDSIHSINGAGSLHHNFDTTSSNYDMISHNHTPLMLDSSITEWRFKVSYDYNPSSGNNWAIWLTGDYSAMEMHPSGNCNGYVIGVNYTGSDDIVKLWRQQNSSHTTVMSTGYNWQNNLAEGDIIEILVTRSEKGIWTISLKPPGEEFLLLGNVLDTLITTSEYIGVYYKYTSTQDMKLWIDDFSLKGSFYKDISAPKIASYDFLNRNEIHLRFNESIDTSSQPNFLLNKNTSPKRIQWRTLQEVNLTFTSDFETENCLDIYNLSDSKGNINPFERLDFKYYIANRYDILLSEIMADPNPVNGLPECEYIEIHNRTDMSIDLTGWSFYSGEREPVTIENFRIEPKEFVLLLDKDFVGEFPVQSKIYPLNALPTLPNSGESLFLYDDNGSLIHSVEYNYSSYNDDLKKEGGWSLELIDFNYPCLQTENWTASIAHEGGTPGFVNSVIDIIDPYPTTRLKSVSRITDTSCVLTFSGILDSPSAINPANYSFENSNIFISNASIHPNKGLEVILQFSESLEKRVVYTLVTSHHILDCSGFEIRVDPIAFGVPEVADSTEIVISEILFEANEEVPEFVEIYNASNKIIDLNKIMLASFDLYTDTLITSKEITSSCYQILPDSYLVLTQNKNLLLSTFTHVQPWQVIELKSWLNLTNTGALIGLVNINGNSIDKAVYSPEMHFELLNSTAGVSLERIRIFSSGTNPENWHSAATNASYATPAAENSQNYENTNTSNTFIIDPTEFSPDNDGLNDYLTINCNFPKGEYVSTIKIFDQQGVLINHLINNDLCGINETFIWDGLDENRSRLSMGYYIVLFEAWHPDGHIIKEKKVVLLLPEKK